MNCYTEFSITAIQVHEHLLSKNLTLVLCKVCSGEKNFTSPKYWYIELQPHIVPVGHTYCNRLMALIHWHLWNLSKLQTFILRRSSFTWIIMWLWWNIFWNHITLSYRHVFSFLVEILQACCYTHWRIFAYKLILIKYEDKTRLPRTRVKYSECRATTWRWKGRVFVFQPLLWF